MIDIDQYKQAAIEHLRSGKASDEVWQEVGEHLQVDSELCGALKLDVELGFAVVCGGCGERFWIDDGERQCDTCGWIAGDP